MKHHTCTVILAALTLTCHASAATNPANTTDTRAQITRSDAQVIALNFAPQGLQLTQVNQSDQTCDAYTLPGEGITLQPGKPMLPAVTRFIVVPPQAGLELRVSASQPRRVMAERWPVVYQELSEDTGIKNPPLLPPYFAGGEDRSQGGIYPPVIAEMSDPAVIRGVRLVKVTTYPVRWDAANRSYLIYDRIEPEIRFTDAAPVNPVEHPRRRHRSRQFLRYLDALALNPPGRDDPDYGEPSPYAGHYAIAANEHCVQYLAPFIEWRRKTGYKVDILPFSDQDAQDPEVVKETLQGLYDSYLELGEDPFDLVLLVGDRSQYYDPPEVGWQLGSFRGESHWPHIQHADFLFGCLEGNDIYTDVGISRFPGGSPQTLNLMVGRTLGYAAEPYMDDLSWFTRGGVYSQHSGNSPNYYWHPAIHTNARWAVEALQFVGFDDIRLYEDHQFDYLGARIGPWIADMLNIGTNLMFGRAQNYYFTTRGQGQFDEEVNENNIFPFDINFNAKGEWNAETVFRQGGSDEYGENLKGFVVTTGCWGENDVYLPIMHAAWMEWLKGLMFKDLGFGWGRTLAITAVEGYCPNTNFSNLPLHEVIKTDVDAFGDPGLQPWLGVPRRVHLVPPRSITAQTRMVEARVIDPENEGAPIPGAQVTFYAPGAMPDPDDEDYANYDFMIMKTILTDADGMARFMFGFGENFQNDETVYLSVTGRDILPFYAEVEVTDPQRAVELAGYELAEAEGNEDEFLNPGEAWELTITAANLGEDDLQAVSATVTSLSPWVEVGGDEIDFGDIASGNEAQGEGEAILSLHPSCPDGFNRPSNQPELLIEFQSGEEVWRSGIKLDPRSPRLTVRAVVEGNVIQPGEQDLDVEIANIGRADAAPLVATLAALGWGATVIRNEAAYPAIAAGETAQIDGGVFRVAGDAEIPPGTNVSMRLILEGEAGFRDTSYFDLQVGEPRANAPSPPDDYGYICYDDSDEDWELAPEYQWVEIDPNEENPDFRGVLIEFEGDQPLDEGLNAVIDLGFATQFYGRRYTQITISTKGYIAMGDQGPDEDVDAETNPYTGVNNFQNWPLDRGFGGGVGMIAPFWDDLRMPEGAGVYYFYDEEEARFIVEWSGLRHNNEGDTPLTFQVILHDPRFWPSFTGDPQILFQYRSIENLENLRQGEYEWTSGVPFASVGVSSPEGTGIGYTFNNDYPVWAAELQERRAILFTTISRWMGGAWVEGYVLDAENDEPLPDAHLITGFGFMAEVDEEGFYRLEVLADFPFGLTAHCQGYNDSTIVVEVPPDSTRRLDFRLLHPEFTPSTRQIDVEMAPESVREFAYSVENTGNGPLEWTVRKRINWNDMPWEQRPGYEMTRLIQEQLGFDEHRIEGVTFADDRFYIAGGDHDPHLMYVMDREGIILDTIPQPGEGRWGMYDLAWDGELLWGSGEHNVYGFTTEGEVRTSFESPINLVQAIAYDRDRDLLWLSGITSQYIYGYNRDGILVARLDRHGLYIFGLAYYPQDRDDHPLYVFTSPMQSESQFVYKIDPETDDTMFVRELHPEGGGVPRGCEITNLFDVYSWVFMNVSSAPQGDRIDVWQLEHRRDWFKLDIRRGEEWIPAQSGTLNAGMTDNYRVTLDTRDLVPLLWEGYFQFEHNAGDGLDSLWIAVDVTLAAEPPGGNNLPVEFGLHALYPNPFNAQTAVQFGVDKPGVAALKVFDLQGREAAVLFERDAPVGNYRLTWNAAGLPSGVYLVRLESAGKAVTRKAVLMK